MEKMVFGWKYLFTGIITATLVIFRTRQTFKLSIDGLQEANLSEKVIGCDVDHNWTDPCEFSPEEEQAPSPLILIALGRSGSSVTWDTISYLTGQRNVAFEVTGGNRNSSQLFFEELERDPLAFHNWTIQRLCHVQQFRPDISRNAGIAGFQWKPYKATFDHEYAIEGLKAISGQIHPKVRVLHLTRDWIDRRVSNIRHHRSVKSHKRISAHCELGDEECIALHSKFDEEIYLPSGKELMFFLQQDQKAQKKIVNRLEEFKVPFITVSYDKLYNSDDADEWMRIFQFLGKGPSKGLTMEKVRESFSMAPTHKKSRNETISNYVEVENTLIGTKFEYLLYEDY